MPFTFPIDLPQLFDTLAVVSSTFDLTEAVESSEKGNGALILNDYGPRMWTGTVSLLPMDGVDMDAVDAALTFLRQSGRPFYVARQDRPGPAFDPDGAILGASAPVLAAVWATGDQIRIEGLPAGYKLAAGDYIGWIDSTGYHHLHKIAFGDTASGSPVRAIVNVVPNVDAAMVGRSVILMRPKVKAVMVPGSYREAVHQNGPSAGPSFMWQEAGQ